MPVVERRLRERHRNPRPRGVLQRVPAVDDDRRVCLRRLGGVHPRLELQGPVPGPAGLAETTHDRPGRAVAPASRHALPAVLSGRTDRLVRELGPKLYQTEVAPKAPPASAAVSRNAPYPCGSGQEFKSAAVGSASPIRSLDLICRSRSGRRGSGDHSSRAWVSRTSEASSGAHRADYRCALAWLNRGRRFSGEPSPQPNGQPEAVRSAPWGRRDLRFLRSHGVFHGGWAIAFRSWARTSERRDPS